MCIQRFNICFCYALNSDNAPGGATALIYVIGSQKIQSLGWLYPLTPIALGTVIMLLIALIVNNMSNNDKRHYPIYWY